MATIVTHTVGIDGGLRDYTSLTTWEAAEQRDLVSADEIEVAECYNDGELTETTSVAIAGWTGDSTHYVRIYTPTSERHSGVIGTGFTLKSTTALGQAISFDVECRVEGLIILCSATEVDGIHIANGCSIAYIISNIIRCNVLQEPVQAHGIDIQDSFGGSTNISYIYNNIICEVLYGIYSELNTVGITYQLYSYSNTIVASDTQPWNLGKCIYRSSTFDGTHELFAKNNITAVLDEGDCFDWPDGEIDAESDYNLSSDDTAPGTHSILNVDPADGFGIPTKDLFIVQAYNFIWTDDQWDCHLHGNSPARIQGTDLSSDSYLPFSDDIDGETRTGSWDIGADQYNSSYSSPIAVNIVTHTVGTNGGLRDYTSLTAWNAGEQRSLRVANEIEVAECYADGIMTDSVEIEGWVTDKWRHIKIYTPDGERHNGTKNSGFHVQTNDAYTYTIAIEDTNVWIDGLEIEQTKTGAGGWYASGLGMTATQKGFIKFSNNLIDGNYNEGNDYGGILIPNNIGTAITVCIWNNFIYNCGQGIKVALADSDLSIFIYNNSLYSGDKGIWIPSTNDVQCKNTACLGFTRAFDQKSYFSNSDYNASTEARSDIYSAPGANSVYECLAEDNYVSVVSNSEDLHIKESADLWDTGIDISSETVLYFTNDIDDGEWDIWDIGADEPDPIVPIPAISLEDKIYFFTRNYCYDEDGSASTDGSSEGSNLPENAIDISHETYWETTDGTPQLKIDLGEERTVDTLWFKSSTNINEYRLYYSDDGSMYTAVGMPYIANGNGYNLCLQFTEQTKRYWRLDITDKDAGNVYIYEVILAEHRLTLSDDNMPSKMNRRKVDTIGGNYVLADGAIIAYKGTTLYEELLLYFQATPKANRDNLFDLFSTPTVRPTLTIYPEPGHYPADIFQMNWAKRFELLYHSSYIDHGYSGQLEFIEK